MKLVGKNGTIVVGEKDCTALISNGILEKKYGKVVQFNSEDLSKWIQRLKIYSNEDGSIKLGSWK